jgi:hypothetical protein
MAALGVVALMAPVAAGAQAGHGKAKGKVRPAPKVTFVFKGTLASVETSAKVGVVSVKRVNRHARAYTGKDVTFDLSSARVVIRDVNKDGKRNLDDAAAGDRVLVQARLPRRSTDVAEPIKARAMVDGGQPKPKPAPESDGSE